MTTRINYINHGFRVAHFQSHMAVQNSARRFSLSLSLSPSPVEPKLKASQASQASQCPKINHPIHNLASPNSNGLSWSIHLNWSFGGYTYTILYPIIRQSHLECIACCVMNLSYPNSLCVCGWEFTSSVMQKKKNICWSRLNQNPGRF